MKIYGCVMMKKKEALIRVLSAILFAVISFTNFLDGYLARKHNLITDFGKLMDPLADKFMVIGAMFVIIYRSLNAETPDKLFCNIFFWSFMPMIQVDRPSEKAS